jgi:hypothetical protein
MKRFTLLALSALLALAFVLPATTAAARPASGGLLTDVPVTGVLENGQNFTGSLNIDEITRVGDQLAFSGSVLDAAGNVVGTFEDVIGILTPGGGQAKCDILFLDLGPIFLDILGLEIDLSQIILDINAVPGPGNLLGNLLCAVFGLLDGGLFGGGLGGLLDRLLDRINDLLG